MRFRSVSLFALLIALVVAAAVSMAVRVEAASSGAAFQEGWRAFHDLKDDRAKNRLRANWTLVENHFLKAYKLSPVGSYAPKSLYYLARVYEEIGSHSGRRDDFEKAVEYYQMLSTKFPDHDWTDDALLRKARLNLERLDRQDQAYLDLLLVVHGHPKGDMHDEAREMLLELDRRNAGLPGAAEAEALDAPAEGDDVATALDAAMGQVSGSAPRSGSGGRSAAAGQMAHLTTIRHRSSSDYTRVVLDLDTEVPYTYNLLKPDASKDRPHRLYIDLSATRLTREVPESTEISDGILERVRTGQYTRQTSRVVLDFQDLQRYHVFALPDPYRVVIDVYAPDKGLRPEDPAGNIPRPRGSQGGGMEVDGQVADLVEQLGLTVRTIMIDPGHGGKDPGARANGLHEKDIVLKLAKKVGERLRKRGFNVIYTRTTDVFIPLEERTAMANVQKADMFVSIHCNAHTKRSIHGLETYSLNLARTKDAVRVASRENAVTEKRISDLQVILTDLMLNSKVRESKDLAGLIQKNVLSSVKRRYPLRDQGIREAPFYVLMGAKMPAVLVEVGYLTHSSESKRLRSNSYQDHLADGIVEGVLDYKKSLERYASL